ncbi:prenyltransferase/squalene oxidase repeat-containing protein [Chloroflexota bacterium]
MENHINDFDVHDYDPSFLATRARRLSVLLESFAFRGERNPLEKIILYLILNQEESGVWGSPDYPPWTDVITAFTIQLFTTIGFHERSTWEVTRSESASTYFGGVSKAITYLLENQKPRGNWGEDFFDTCQVLKALLPFIKKMSLETQIDKGLTYIKNQIDEDMIDERDSEWFGPGFYAAGADLFNILGDLETTNHLLEQMYKRQTENGVFCSQEIVDQAEFNDLSLWHTSWAVLAMHSLGIPSEARRLSSSIQWLIEHQNPNGSWGMSLLRHRAIFTSYCLLAIVPVTGENSDIIASGIQWLVERQADDGRVLGIEGTVMAALAFSKIFQYSIAVNIPLNVLLDIQDLIRDHYGVVLAQQSNIKSVEQEMSTQQDTISNYQTTITEQANELNSKDERLETLSTQVSELGNDIGQWEERWKNHPIRLSTRFLTISGWIVGIVSLILAVVTLIFPSLGREFMSIFSLSTPTVPPP